MCTKNERGRGTEQTGRSRPGPTTWRPRLGRERATGTHWRRGSTTWWEGGQKGLQYKYTVGLNNIREFVALVFYMG